MLLRKCLPIILAILLISAFSPLPIAAAGNTYYVAKSGSDSNPGTEGLPWLTIQKAVNTMAAGDTVYVKSGTYTEMVSIVSRPSNLTLKTYTGSSPVIDGTGLSTGSTGILTIRNTDYLTIDGFEIANTTASTGGYGIYASRDLDHLTLKNLKVHNINKGGLRIDGEYNQSTVMSPTGTVTNLLIDGCEVYDTNRIYASNEQVSLIRVNGFEIKNSKFHDAGINGIDVDGKDGVDFKNGTSNGSIHDCEMYGSGYIYGDDYSGTSWNGLYIDCNGASQSNIDVYNNYFHDIACGAIVLGNEEGNQSLTNVDIYNNIFYNNQYALRIYPHNFTRNYRFINNTCYKNYTTIMEHSNSGRNLDCVIRNNILSGTSTSDSLINIVNYTVTGIPAIDHNLYYNPTGYRSTLTTLTGGYTPKDPLFVSTPTDLRVQSNSPAIGAGSSDGAPTFDYNGNARGTSVDIGAYEYATSSVNSAPVLSDIGNKTVNEGASLSFTISATDADGDALSYSAANLPSGAAFNAAARTFSWTPSYSQAGTYSGVRFSVSDGTATDYEDIAITVTNINQAPVLSAIGNKTVNEGISLSFIISATDADGDALTYSASNLPSGAAFNPATRTFTWTPNDTQSGSYPAVRFSVSDGTATDFEDITITVNESSVAVNQAPILSAIGNKSVNEGASLSFTISATDADGDALSYSAANLPSGAAFNAATRIFSWTPNYSQAGTYTNVRFTVSDGSATDYENITITVGNINQAPVLAAIGGKKVNEGASLSFTVSATDADGDAVSYSAANLPSGAAFNAATRTFSWTPSYSQAGTYANVRFSVSDGSATDYENTTLTVAHPYADWDTNQDGSVNVLDMIVTGQQFGETGPAGWIKEDVNHDGLISVLDNDIIGQHLVQ